MEKKYLSKDKLVGKQVIDSEAVIAGKVKDMVFDLDSKEICVTITTKTGEEVTVSGSDIGNVGDVVLVKRKIDLPEAVSTAPPVSTSSPLPSQGAEVSAASSLKPGLCRNCSYQNDVTAKFCIKCGTKL
jgi:sporulation protein YlmC with PRC-barrel domain